MLQDGLKVETVLVDEAAMNANQMTLLDKDNKVLEMCANVTASTRSSLDSLGSLGSVGSNASSSPRLSGSEGKGEEVVRGLATTVIGSFPKPDYLKIPDWFSTGVSSEGASDATRQYTEMLTRQTSEQAALHEDNVVCATKDVIECQMCCGVGVVTDGEIRRENYIHYLCRFIEGIDFVNLTNESCRGGAYHVELPTIRSKIAWRGPLDCSEEWRKAQDLSPAPVKYTIPGPMTIMGTLHNAFYADEQELGADLAVIVNAQIKLLVAAGCRHIQVDEPVFCRRPDEALAWGVTLLDRCFETIDGSACERQVHMCCGYPDHLDQEGYLKADPKTYFRLAPAIDACCVDAVSIEDAHCHNDLTLLELFQNTKVILGVVKTASSKVESVEEIGLRLSEALKHIDAERLIVAPDCGLGLLPTDLIKLKLTNMCTAAMQAGCCCSNP